MNPLVKDRPQREEPTLSLLERLSNPETHKEKRIPLRERLSDKLKPLLSRLGRRRAPNRKLSSKSVRSLPQSKLEMSNLSSTHLNDTLQLSTTSRPSLLNRLNMDSDSSTPFSESERKSLVMGISDMKHLTGILPESLTQSTSTTSLKDYPRAMSPNIEMMTQEESQAVTNSQTMNLMNEGSQTKNRGFTNHKCHGIT